MHRTIYLFSLFLSLFFIFGALPQKAQEGFLAPVSQVGRPQEKSVLSEAESYSFLHSLLESLTQAPKDLTEINQLPELGDEQHPYDFTKNKRGLITQLFNNNKRSETVDLLIKIAELAKLGKKIEPVIVTLKGKRYQLLVPAITIDFSSWKQGKIYFSGVWALDEKGEKVLLRLKKPSQSDDGLFLTIKSRRSTNIEGGSTEEKITLGRTASFSLPEGKGFIEQYGGDYLFPLYLNTPPVLSLINFYDIHFAHETASKNVKDIFAHGLLPNVKTGRAFGDNLHDHYVSVWIRNQPTIIFFGNQPPLTGERQVIFLIDLEKAKAAKLKIRIPTTELGDLNPEQLKQTGVVEVVDKQLVNAPIFENWIKTEGQTGEIPATAISALAVPEEELNKHIQWMEEGFIPPIPIYSRSTGALLNKAYLEEKNKNFIYDIKDPVVKVVGRQIKVDFSLFSGDWDSKKIVDDLGLMVKLRFGFNDDEGKSIWSDETSDLEPLSFSFLERTPENGYRLEVLYRLPPRVKEKVQFVLKLTSKKGQTLWLKNGESNFEIALEKPQEPNKTTLFDISL